jgi:hypothetical protein
VPFDAAWFATPAFIAAALLAALGVALLLAGLARLLRARVVGGTLRTLSGLLLIALAGVALLLSASSHAYRALTREEVAARITVTPTGPQRFDATFRFPDGSEAIFALAGDELYVDAHVIKWRPWASLLGVHTAYDLDRVAGRYRSIDDERAKPRTVYELGPEKAIDLASLRKRFAWLSPLYDAEYGSAAFVPAASPRELTLTVSTSGLVLRDAAPSPK